MYYSEKYVESFLHTMSAQDYKDIEIICVVDGSLDNTYHLACEVAKEDSRIKVINQEHAGAGEARNVGFSISKGDYVMFMDVDDLYPKNYVSKMVSLIEKTDADIGVCKFIVDNSWWNVKIPNQGYNGRNIKSEIMKPDEINSLFCDINVVVHNKIFKRKLIEENNLSFSKTTSINDISFMCKALVCANKIAFINESLYTYRKYHNKNSITTNRKQCKEDLFTVYEDIYEWLKSHKIEKKYLKTFCEKYRGSFRATGKTEEDEIFAKNVADYLLTSEPWVNMQGKELLKEAGLYSVASKIRKAINSFKKGEHIKEISAQYDNEIKNIDKIKELINSHGLANIKVPLVQEIKWVLDDLGLEKSIKTTLQDYRIK